MLQYIAVQRSILSLVIAYYRILQRIEAYPQRANLRSAILSKIAKNLTCITPASARRQILQIQAMKVLQARPYGTVRHVNTSWCIPHHIQAFSYAFNIHCVGGGILQYIFVYGRCFGAPGSPQHVRASRGRSK